MLFLAAGTDTHAELEVLLVGGEIALLHVAKDDRNTAAFPRRLAQCRILLPCRFRHKHQHGFPHADAVHVQHKRLFCHLLMRFRQPRCAEQPLLLVVEQHERNLLRLFRRERFHQRQHPAHTRRVVIDVVRIRHARQQQIHHQAVQPNQRRFRAEDAARELFHNPRRYENEHHHHQRNQRLNEVKHRAIHGEHDIRQPDGCGRVVMRRNKHFRLVHIAHDDIAVRADCLVFLYPRRITHFLRFLQHILAEPLFLSLAFAHRKPRIDLLHPAIRIHFFCSFSVYGTTSTTVSVSPSTTKRISTSPYGTPYTRFPSC